MQISTKANSTEPQLYHHLTQPLRVQMFNSYNFGVGYALRRVADCNGTVFRSTFDSSDYEDLNWPFEFSTNSSDSLEDPFSLLLSSTEDLCPLLHENGGYHQALFRFFSALEKRNAFSMIVTPIPIWVNGYLVLSIELQTNTWYSDYFRIGTVVRMLQPWPIILVILVAVISILVAPLMVVVLVTPAVNIGLVAVVVGHVAAIIFLKPPLTEANDEPTMVVILAVILVVVVLVLVAGAMAALVATVIAIV
ncbi:hypothetical protein V5O48_013171 [Marasmius crinis-equi]|uniref:Yip1 domain-containing protein n=1 Tax=Marasmius crinis-equi TaxID=585013 RepID=A0ABR3F0U2_9AGAR